jgi:hypothetical protein
MTLFMRAATGLALLGLAGCADLPIYTVNYDDTYHPGETKQSTPVVPVLVRGNPYGIPQPEFNNAVADAMQGWSAWQDHFTAEGNQNAAYRVAMVFSPTTNVGVANYCARPLGVDGASGATLAPRVRVAAVLCRGSSYLSDVEGDITVTGGPDGAAFRKAVGEVTMLLFPVQNPLASNCPSC